MNAELRWRGSNSSISVSGHHNVKEGDVVAQWGCGSSVGDVVAQWGCGSSVGMG
jgi:hypothetical protein